MRRAPKTFTQVLLLVTLALALALGISAALSARIRLKFVSQTYSGFVVSTALAADSLAARGDDASLRTLARLRQAGVSFATGTPPASRRRVAPLLTRIGLDVGRRLGDPSRVRVRQMPDAQIWIRSVHDPNRWIVLHATGYRGQAIASTLLVVILAGLIALAVAAIAARLLARPLEHLAKEAPALLNGDPMREQLRGSPREVRQLAHALAAAGERQRGIARERELLLAGVSHDLRTPLARLRLALELGDASDTQRRDAMIADLEELDAALEQCLAFVRDGRDEALREVDLATLIGQLIALRTQPDAWDYAGPDSLSMALRPTLLRRALGNLMDNAERYGAAPFRVSLEQGAKDTCVRVEDRGPGVPDALLSRLGTPFMRGDQARRGGGSGLGLSIASRAAELHGGALELRNGNQGGFIAVLRLPVAPRNR